MVAMPKNFCLPGRRQAASERATVVAFKVGEKAHRKNGGATPLLREIMQLYKDSVKPE